MKFGCHFDIYLTSSISNFYEMSYNLQKVLEWVKGQGNLITFLREKEEGMKFSFKTIVAILQK
jgi:hypothetical protein